MGSAPSVLSMVRVTSARPSGGRPEVPAKMKSSILPPRSALAPCSPSTQAMASTTLDLPEPLGPTTAVMPGSNRRVVAEAKDLKPFRVSDLRCTQAPDVVRRRGRQGSSSPAEGESGAMPAAEISAPGGENRSGQRGALVGSGTAGAGALVGSGTAGAGALV